MVPLEASCPHPGRAPFQLSGMAVWPVPEELVTARGAGWRVGGQRRPRADTPPPAPGKAQHSRGSGPNFPQIRLSAEKSARSWGDARAREGVPPPPGTPWPPRARPSRRQNRRGVHAACSDSRGARRPLEGVGGPRRAGQRGARGAGHSPLAGGSLRSRARGARDPPGRRRRRRPGSGGRGDEPARESSGGHGPGRAVHGGPRYAPAGAPGRRRAHASRRPRPAPRGGAASGPAPPAGAGLLRPGAGAEQARPPPPGDRARGAPGARTSGLPPQFPLARPGREVEGVARGKFGAPPRGCLPGSLRPCTPALVGWEGAPGFSHDERAPSLSCGEGRPEVGGPTIPPSAAPYPCPGVGAAGDK